MSLGYIGYGRYNEEIDGCLIYEYSGENWNAQHNEGDCLLYDGLFSIQKNVLVEESCVNAIKDGRIKILKECKNAFNRFKDTNFDYLALRIIIHIFNDYKESGEIPQKVTFIQ